MLCSMEGTKIAEVEGLWLVNRPEHPVSEDPDDSPMVWLCSPFIVPPQWHKRSLWHHFMMSWLSAFIFQQENHYACASETWSFVCTSASIHARIPNTINASEPLHLFLNPISMPVTYIKIFNIIYSIFNVHNNACRPSQDGFQTGSSSNGDEGWHLLCTGGWWLWCCHMLERRAHLLICPCYPKHFLQVPHWVPKVLHSGLGFTAPRYTGVIPATCTGPGQLGSDLNKLQYCKQGVNRPLR